MKTNQLSQPSAKPLKGLRASIMKSPLYKGCSNGGISETCNSVTIVGPGIAEVFEADSDAPAVKFVVRNINGIVVHLEPVAPVKKGNVGYMAGGAVVSCCDSRFGEALQKLGYPSHCAVILHDRQDTPEDYAALSR